MCRSHKRYNKFRTKIKIYILQLCWFQQVSTVTPVIIDRGAVIQHDDGTMHHGACQFGNL